LTKKLTKAQVIKKRILAVTLKVSFALLLVLFFSVVLISIPAVQTRIINKITDSIFEKINHNVDMAYINIRWFDTILINGLIIYDTKNQKMISADRLILDFKLGELLSGKQINFDKAILQGASVDMLKNGPEGVFNLTYFIDEIKEKLVKKKPEDEVKAFQIDKVILTNSRFRMYRSDRELITHRFDQFHFTLTNLGANMSDFQIIPGQIDFNIDALKCLDSATGMSIEDVKTSFQFTRQAMVFQNMQLQTDRSRISQSMVFNYRHPSSIKEFVDSVKITANVKDAIIHSQDLAYFAPAMKKYNQVYKLQGFLEGPVKRFHAQDITLRFGAGSSLKGYLSMYGLPNFEETFIDASVIDASIQARDLTPYSSTQSITTIRKFGNLSLQGRFSGFPIDFVSNATFKTDIGSFDTDINLKLAKSPDDLATYSGRLKTQDFDLGLLLGDTAVFQKIDMNGRISGSGFSRSSARFDLLSTISRLGIKGYDYRNIQTDATLASEFFKGNLKVDDPNLDFSGNMSIDLKQENEIIQVEAVLAKSNLDTLQITNKPAFLSSKLNVDMRGLQLDEMLGEAYLSNTVLRYDGNEAYLDTLSLLSEKDSLSRSLKLKSPFANLHIFGNFDYTNFFSDLKDVYHEYRLIFRNNSEEINNYYQTHQKDFSDYYFLDYDIALKNINPLVQLFEPDFHLSHNTSIIGSFTGGPVTLLQFESALDTLKFKHLAFEGSNVMINTQKSSDTTLVYATYELTSEVQKIDNVPSSRNLNLEVDWSGNTVDFLVNVEQAFSSNYAKTSGQVRFLPDTTLLSMRPSEISVMNKIWRISEGNSVMIRDKNYDIRNFGLYHGDQRITVNGKLTEDPGKNLFIAIKNFDIENLNPLISKRLDGIFNGLINVKDYFHRREINSRVNVRDFSVNEFLVGNIIASSKYDNEQAHLDVKINVKRNGHQTMLVEGTVKPDPGKEQLALNAVLSRANLNLIEPFFEDYISDVSGFLDGHLKITGEVSNPRVVGSGETREAEFTLDYLNTHYGLQGKIAFDEDIIDFQNFQLTDNQSNTGILNGRISHNGFRQLEYDFTGQMNNFLVLNTTSKDNSLYYGTAYATGDLKIYGREKVFNIDARAVSNRGTRFFIPLDGSDEVVQEDFINFISVKDTVELMARNTAKRVDLAGINLNLDLEITPDAYCEIIFDLQAGDIIRGRGNGKVNLQIDTKGDFNMFGDYEILEGGYNFTLYNIINKEFVIEPGGRISWSGDPYAATLDIRANYEQLASLMPILTPIGGNEADLQDNPELQRKYPAKVILDIRGNLMYPEIDFDIDVEDYPQNATYNGVSIETQMVAFKTKLATDEQEMKRQVFSLIILRRFSDENAFNVGGSIGKSVSEFISNQISYWVTQFDENLVLDVDLGSLDNEAFNTFQLRMSYSFLGGRLRVTRDGGFTDQATGTTAESILGDWTVEYLLSPDGMLRAKIYNRTNYNTLDPTNRQTTQTAGFSVMHTLSFDQIKDIFKKTRNKNRQVEADGTQNDKDSDQGISQLQDPVQQF
jgi:hypothetical protein